MKHVPSKDLTKEMATGCLAARLRILNRAVTRVYDDALRSHGIRVNQLNILVALAAAGPLRSVDLAPFMQMDASTLSRDVERLLDRGWLRALEAPGRSRPFEVTEAGRRLISAVAPAWREAQREARTLLTPALADGVSAVVNEMWDRLGPPAADG